MLRKRIEIFEPTYIKIILEHKTSKLYKCRAWNLKILEVWYEIYKENNGLKPLSF